MLITENWADKSADPSATRPRNTVTLWIYKETGQDVRSSKSEVPVPLFPADRDQRRLRNAGDLGLAISVDQNLASLTRYGC